MALSTRYQTTTPYEGLATWVAAMLSPTTLSGGGGEGLYWGGVGSVDNGYPAFLALVKDDTGRIWPCGSSVATAIEFVDSEGECSLYLIPFDKVSVPSYVSTRIGSFSVVAQLTASAAPASSLLLGAGTVESSVFTSFTEASGVRRDSLGMGSGADGDIVLLARNGDENLPGLRYHAASGAWQYSNDGETWLDLGSSNEPQVCVLWPEYAGGVLLVSEAGYGSTPEWYATNELAEGAAGNANRNYYHLGQSGTGEATATAYVKWTLPTGFRSWADEDVIAVTFRTSADLSTGCGLKLELYHNQTGPLGAGTYDAGGADWGEATWSDMGSGTWAAGDVLTIVVELKVNRASGSAVPWVDLAEIKIAYKG